MTPAQREQIEALTLRSLGRRPLSILPMPGGASTRKYFRVRFENTAVVAMYVPDGGKPEELGSHETCARWPFLEIRDLLESRGVDVPRVVAEQTGEGWLLLEDLGDDTLANFIARRPEKKSEYYSRAVLDLAAAQTALADLPADCIVPKRVLNEETLFQEMDGFREWALEARGHRLPPSSRRDFDATVRALAQRIAGFRRSFVHRDYQSRNLMVRSNGSLVWIDFQDSLWGPRIYDLVALLNDSYQSFERRFILERIEEYARAVGLEGEESVQLASEFDYVTVQRKMKDAGRFVFIEKTKGNDAFSRFVDPTLRKIAKALHRLATGDPQMLGLERLLESAMPEVFGASHPLGDA